MFGDRAVVAKVEGGEGPRSAKRKKGKKDEAEEGPGQGEIKGKVSVRRAVFKAKGKEFASVRHRHFLCRDILSQLS